MFKFALCLFFLFSFASYAQETKEKTDTVSLTSSLIGNYPLTEDLLLKLEKIAKECKNLPSESKTANSVINPITYNSNIYSSIENYTTYISKKTRLMHILERNNLTAEDFAAGTLTLIEVLMFLAFAPEKEHSPEKNIISTNNFEFAKKHFYKINTLLDICEELI
ncbi:hypothetical protein [Bartonella pachyuromydis]|uniref:Uncharacterized protein n=1 Tax=Bartonella pachyuromydis TaxID=931097 RepID=A0ABP8VBP7_9HYPH